MALVTCWRTVPLVLLSRYGVSVVPYTESAQVTSLATSLLNIFRGTETWVSYLVVNGLTWWPLGFQIATEALPTLLTGLLAALGLAGLVHREIPERRFLLSFPCSATWCVRLARLSSAWATRWKAAGRLVDDSRVRVPRSVEVRPDDWPAAGARAPRRLLRIDSHRGTASRWPSAAAAAFSPASRCPPSQPGWPAPVRSARSRPTGCPRLTG